MILSLIIPCYNSEPYIDELMKSLLPQVTDEVEVIVIDDGSDFPYLSTKSFVKVYRTNENKGVSAARNLGMKKAKGKYIAFIDSDDIVAADYIKKILEKLESDPDTIYLSWRTINGKAGKIIESAEDEFNPWNRCVWNRVFKVSWLNGLRFNEDMQVAEDDDFLKRLPEEKKKEYISEYVYYYRSGRIGSLTDRNRNGEFAPRIKTQVVIYCGNTAKIGGIETWIYYFCKNMYQLYDIMVVFSQNMDGRQIARLSEIVQVYKLTDKVIECDTLIHSRISDQVPELIKAKQIIQMVHACNIYNSRFQENYDKLVFVSEAAAKTYDKKPYEVIHNFTYPSEPRKCLFLITASRFTKEKGGERMVKLANALRKAKIEFIWFVFSHQDTPLTDGMVKLPENLNVKDYIARCDYLVQLSDSEGFGYSIVEALELGVPVITTPISVLSEIGFQEGRDGYTVPFDMADLNVERFLQIPETQLTWDNDKIRKQWVKLLGKSKPTGDYLRIGSHVTVQILENYFDLEIGRELVAGEEVEMRRARANLIVGCGKAVILR